MAEPAKKKSPNEELIRSLLADVTAAFEAIVVSLQVERAHGEMDFALDEARRRVARLRARLAEGEQRQTGS